eukprot:CAMPEP_0198567412 /NCGR_PEP_ID=MMETSP1462-20131121/104757_1 /TAXON_ID=1333877 /ORGANISM="Brandtodinium nutriculum, Strain RCC3387" /LENGTH=51 /DNA_ID=CAMNT_0044298459 /DNA_START=14 /DNA_END=165 /DNA_ORIENTATION=-
MPHQGDVHFGQKAFDNPVELPHHHTQFGKLGPVKVHQRMPQQQSQGALEDR